MKNVSFNDQMCGGVATLDENNATVKITKYDADARKTVTTYYGTYDEALAEFQSVYQMPKWRYRSSVTIWQKYDNLGWVNVLSTR